MKRPVLLSTAAILLLAATFAACPERETTSAPAATTVAGEAQQRFLINYCYAQFRGQTDIAQCLARGV